MALGALSVGLITANSGAAPASVLFGPGQGGVLARCLILPAILIPPALGYLRVAGQQGGFYDTSMGTAALVMALAILFTALIWQTAVTLDATDRARAAVQDERDDLLVRETTARQAAERARASPRVRLRSTCSP